jgi:predicted amidohydrolase YtcJ
MLANVQLEGARTIQEIQNRIGAFAKAHPERSWIQGMGWAYEAFPGDYRRGKSWIRFDGHSV